MHIIDDVDTFWIEVDQLRAAELGVSSAQLGLLVRTAFAGAVVTKYERGDGTLDVRSVMTNVRLAKGELFVTSGTGGLYAPNIPVARIQTAGGDPVLVPVGSLAVREAIEEVQPVLSLHGHIHESRAMGSIGRTQICNPGSLYTEGALRGVIVQLDKDKVKLHKFVTG